MASFFSKLFGKDSPPSPTPQGLQPGAMCEGNSDWLLVLGSNAEKIQAAVVEHSELCGKEVPGTAKMKLSSLDKSRYVLQFDQLPAYELVNLINWLSDPTMLEGTTGCYGWYRSPGSGERYLLYPNALNPQGDTVQGVSQAGQSVEIYLPENRMCEISREVPSLAEPELDSLQVLAEFEIQIELDKGFGNPDFVITDTKDFTWFT